MQVLRPLPRSVTRPVSLLVLIAWATTIGLLIHRSYVQASSRLATDLARYGSAAQWRGVYYRGEKIGFTVSQTVPVDEGYELHEDGQLQMSLLGATTAARIRTTARVGGDFTLKSFEFSLDPGTGPTEVRGRVDGRRLAISIASAGATRTDVRDLPEPPLVPLNLSRVLANGGLVPGARRRLMVFDPATLNNAPVVIDVGRREVVRVGSGRVPAFRVDMTFVGLRTTSWITDTGEVVREESPLGLITMRESPEAARMLAVPFRVQADLLESSAVVPAGRWRIDEPRDVRRLRLQIEGADLSGADLQGAGQRVDGNIVELRDVQAQTPGPADPEASRYLAAEPLIESDDPDVRAEAARAVQGANGSRDKAERLTRYVNALLDKKPTVSLPSAREVLRTKVGDCNEHTALYVAMARAAGVPSRIAVGLVYVRGARGAFYYHAWPEVYIDERNSGFWLPVDPTFNQFPADATHLRLARGGLDKQAAIIPLVGRLKMTVLDLELAPGATPILVGGQAAEAAPLVMPIPRQTANACCTCWR